MISKESSPKFLSGKIYFVEDVYTVAPKDFQFDYENCTYYEMFPISRGIIIPNGDNSRIKFDFNFMPDYYNGFVTGFLYDDGIILGKGKYVKEAKMEDSHIRGFYKKINETWILVCGTWTYSHNTKYHFWIDISEEGS